MAEKLHIINHIRKLRFFADEMTQLELAEKAGVSRQTIVALEAGKYSPSLELAFKIANVFAVPIGEVFECQPKNSEVIK
ncbi:helix-turn-helix transcriptional regulator [Culicoidibacter larvae]|uniref:Helix-turn-helix transcriptional regulator n=1 Tax=Culicoidibacter larvae TaxID=2579976 RepID=A0A5R8QH56_9FIRM|nr:helix-turn-helix transcriptional regulator [Culicoidibacter larvae]TLG77371.1 helix-turn-helix transcriptional regulator [Culicoidibacter larvae]